MTKYQKQIERYGRLETVTDVRAFAADLSKALNGGELQPAREDSIDDAMHRGCFSLGDDLIMVTGNYYHSKGRVTVHIEAPEIKHGDKNIHSKDHRTTSATVNPDGRSIDAIAKDIKKRVIEASQPALKLQREFAAQRNQARENIVEHMHTLSSAVPGLSVNRRSPDEQNAAIYSGSGNHYVSATLNSDGTVSISHLGSMSIEKFTAVMKLLNGAKQ